MKSDKLAMAFFYAFATAVITVASYISLREAGYLRVFY